MERKREVKERGQTGSKNKREKVRETN